MSYCIKCKKATESKNPEIKESVNGKKYESSICSICGTKKTRFLSRQQTEEPPAIKVISEENIIVKKKGSGNKPTPTPQSSPATTEPESKRKSKSKKIHDESTIIINA